jgi:glycosyltransferase involved in cell wall biosynthesis
MSWQAMPSSDSRSDPRVEELPAEPRSLRAENEHLRQQLGKRDQELAEARQRSETMAAKLATVEAELRGVLGSMSWRFVRGVCRTADHLAPAGTIRRSLLHGGLRVGSWLAAWPLRAGRWLLQRCLPRPGMSWHAYAFDRYRVHRDAAAGRGFAGVQPPVRRGLVSVVLPVYNGEDYVRESLDSVLAQTWREFELIVVDDGSNDGTPAILAEYAARDPRIRIVRQANQRLPRALSNGFREARGEFLTWTSADNRMKPECLARMVDCLERHPDWDMIWANVDIIGENGQPLRGSSWYLHYQDPPGSEHVRLPGEPLELNVWPNNYVGAAFLYRARVRVLLGDYSPRRFGLEDYDYWMRVNELLTLRHADFAEPIYDYRFHDTSLTSRDRELGITRSRQRMMVFDEFRRDFALTPIAWFVDAAAAGAATVRERFVAAVAAAGHRLFDRAEIDASRWPPLWALAIHVRFVAGDQPGGSPPPGLPAGTLTALVALDDAPRASEGGWDFCVRLGVQTPGSSGKDPREDWTSIADLPCLLRALDVRCRADHVAGIEQKVEEPGPDAFDATVVICTYKRSERLARALDSVLRQSLPAERYEVLIVDNGNEHGDIAGVVAECVRAVPDGPAVRLLHCAQVGLSHARNAGLSVARGRCLLFLDDDAHADREWVEAMVRAFDGTPEAGVIGGRILLQPPAAPPPWFRDQWRSFWSHFDPSWPAFHRAAGWWEYPWGANWGARRIALLQACGFRSSYGRVGQDFGGGEELVAAQVIASLGWVVGVEPSSRVVHDVEPSRFTWQHVCRTLRSGMHVAYQMQRDLYVPMEPGIYRAWLRTMMRALGEMAGWSNDLQARRLGWQRALAACSLLRRQVRDRWRRRRGPRSLRAGGR